MAERKVKQGPPELPEAPTVSPCGLSGLDARLTALGVSPAVLAEVRGLTRTNGSGMVDLLIQKKVLPETELLSALSAEYGIPSGRRCPRTT